jgi:hypothetical protein
VKYSPRGKRSVGCLRERWKDQLHLEGKRTGTTSNTSQLMMMMMMMMMLMMMKMKYTVLVYSVSLVIYVQHNYRKHYFYWTQYAFMCNKVKWSYYYYYYYNPTLIPCTFGVLLSK